MDAGRRSAYLRDFEARIKDVDTCVSVKAGHAPSLIFIYEERPNKVWGYHAEDMASYYPRLKVPPLHAPTQSKRAGRPTLYFSAYLIYAPMVAKFVEHTLERRTLAGHGDQTIREFWAILAVTLVRFRVLAHKELFHGAKLRTKEDMVKHRLLFTAHNDEIEGLHNIESQYAKLESPDREDPYNVDTFWTLQLVAHALEAGHTFEEALEYIIRG